MLATLWVLQFLSDVYLYTYIQNILFTIIIIGTSRCHARILPNNPRAKNIIFTMN